VGSPYAFTRKHSDVLGFCSFAFSYIAIILFLGTYPQILSRAIKDIAVYVVYIQSVVKRQSEYSVVKKLVLGLSVDIFGTLRVLQSLCVIVLVPSILRKYLEHIVIYLYFENYLLPSEYWNLTHPSVLLSGEGSENSLVHIRCSFKPN
jgi:hypothetical protein